MKTMQLKFYILGAVLILISACTKNFEEINKNPNAATTISVDYLFSHSQLKTATSGDNGYENWRANLIYSECMIQHMASTEGYWVGDKYFYDPGYSASLFDKAYTNELKDLISVLDSTKDNAALANKYAAARIWKVVIFQRLTDLYGDIPYSEAGMGYDKQIFSPKYDAQSDIYADMLNELDQACSSFDASKETFGSADLVYGGDVDKWKRFGYSMMLRLAMRESKVDPSNAQTWAQKAIAGGVMQSNDDNCFIAMADGPTQLNQNGNSIALSQGEPTTPEGGPRLSQTFVDSLKNYNDPRLRVYGELPDGNTNPADQKGLPPGSDAITAPDLSIYTRPNLTTVGLLSAPMYFQTYAEVEFMLAEAAVRGWGASDAASHYNAGVTAALLYVNNYGPAVPIDQSEVDAYLAAKPYNPNGDQLNQINTQYWLATFLNGYEAFANWRRCGYPLLIPVNYPGNVTNGTIPRRLQYPQNEYSNNPDGIASALSRQGPDLLTTRVWWDTP